MSVGHVLLPLYIYPDPGAWDNAFGNITQNPNVQFTVVINPDSGPDTGEYPISDYIDNIARLHSYQNTKVIGYVDTKFSAVTVSAVNSQVDQYIHWSTYKDADIHMDGIFFDDMNGTYVEPLYTYYKKLSDHAKKHMPAGHNWVLFNPGTSIDTEFFDLADEVIVFEDFYYSEDWGDDIFTYTPEQYNPKSTVLIHHFNDGAAKQAEIIKKLQDHKYGGVYISTTGDYHPQSGTPLNQMIYEYISDLWSSFCSQMY